MDYDFKRRLVGWGWIAAGVGAFLTGLLAEVGQHDPVGFFGPNVAAWVQAIGTILAVLVAVVLQEWDRRQRQKIERDATWAAVLELTDDLLFSLASTAERVDRGPPNPLIADLAEQDFGELQTAFGVLALRPMNSDKIRTVFSLKRAAMLAKMGAQRLRVAETQAELSDVFLETMEKVKNMRDAMGNSPFAHL